MIDHLDRLDKAVDLIDRTRKEDNKSKIMCQCYHGKHNSVTLLVRVGLRMKQLLL